MEDLIIINITSNYKKTYGAISSFLLEMINSDHGRKIITAHLYLKLPYLKLPNHNHNNYIMSLSFPETIYEMKGNKISCFSYEKILQDIKIDNSLDNLLEFISIQTAYIK